MFYCCGITDKGIKSHNEDALLIHRKILHKGSMEFYLTAPFIAAVCDGVSGEKSGEIASKLCLENLKCIKYTHETDLLQVVDSIHSNILKKSLRRRKHLNMQTTLCAIAVDEDNNILSLNIGDSRLYLYKNASLKQISKDQSLVQMLCDEGRITAYEKRKHSHRNLIFPVIGNKDSKPYAELKPIMDGQAFGDLFLLCTDGLTDYLSNSDIEDILSMPLHLSKRLRKLVDTSIENGCKDNISVVAVCNMNKA